MKKDKLFWFTNFEYNNQTSVSEVALGTRTFGDGEAFASTFDHLGQAPLNATISSMRASTTRLSDKHNAFLRYSEEHNHSLQFNAGNESVWTSRRQQRLSGSHWSHQRSFRTISQ